MQLIAGLREHSQIISRSSKLLSDLELIEIKFRIHPFALSNTPNSINAHKFNRSYINTVISIDFY